MKAAGVATRGLSEAQANALAKRLADQLSSGGWCGAAILLVSVVQQRALFPAIPTEEAVASARRISIHLQRGEWPAAIELLVEELPAARAATIDEILDMPLMKVAAFSAEDLLWLEDAGIESVRQMAMSALIDPKSALRRKVESIILDMPLVEWGVLDTRLLNQLEKSHGAATLRHMLVLSPSQLRDTPNVGVSTVAKIDAFLVSIGFRGLGE